MSTSKGPTLAVLPVAKSEASSARPQILQPSGWPTPKGYANGMAADGRYVVTGGVIGGIRKAICRPISRRRSTRP